MAFEDSVKIGRRDVEAANSDEALALALEQVFTSGHKVVAASDGATTKRDGSSEILGFQLSITDSRDRLLTNQVRSFNIVGAVARFVWMMAGNDRLDLNQAKSPAFGG